MARTPSKMIPLGTKLPYFLLPDTVSGRVFSSNELNGAKASVVMFICNHCPYVKHVNKGIVSLANDYISKGVLFVAISSNDIEQFPEDAPEKMKETASLLNYPFPYLYDETQDIAREFDAACTPDFYIFDGEQKLAYRGQLDDSRPSMDTPVTGKDMRAALDNILNGQPASELQRPSIGCNIKWKKEPA
jgi:thiol-disulfide isomerase/thioredoxin